MNNLFVYCEIEEGNVLDVSLELLTKGRSLANQLNCQLEAVVAGTGLKDIEKQILPYGVDKLHVFDGEGLYPYTSLPHTAILVNLFKEEQPQICLMGATVIGRDLGPRVSSALTSGLTADCTSLEIGDHEDKKEGKTYKNLLYQIRPAFGGNIVATIVNPEHRPQMATVREGVMKKEILSPNYQGEVIRHDVKKYVADTDYVVKVIERHVEKAKNNLKGSPIIVAGGYGVGSKENFDLLFDLAKELHAEVVPAVLLLTLVSQTMIVRSVRLVLRFVQNSTSLAVSPDRFSISPVCRKVVSSSPLTTIRMLRSIRLPIT